MEKNKPKNNFKIERLRILIDNIKRYQLKNNLNTYDIIDSLLKKPSEVYSIPIELFTNRQLSSFEIIVKFLKENLNLRSKKIADLLKRSYHTINATYRNSKKKFSSPLILTESRYLIPLSIFQNRKFSILESLVSYLKIKHCLPLHEIARLLNRNERTIWTVYDRFKKKND